MVDSTSSHYPSRLQLVTEKLVRRKSRSSQEVNLSQDVLEHLRLLVPAGGSESDADISAGEDSDSANHTSLLDLLPSSPVALKLPPRPSSRQGFNQLPRIPQSPGPSLGAGGSSSGDYAKFGPSVEETDGIPAYNRSPDTPSSSSEEEEEEEEEDDWTEESTAGQCLSVSGAILPIKMLPSHPRDWDGSFLPPSPDMMRQPNRDSPDSDLSAKSTSLASSRSSVFMPNQRLSTDSTPQRRLSTPHVRRASMNEVLSAEDTPEQAKRRRSNSVDFTALHSAPLYPRDCRLSCSALAPLIRTLDLSSNCLESVDGLCDARVFRRLNALKDLDLKHNKLDSLNEDLFKVATGQGWLLVGHVGEAVGGCRSGGCSRCGCACVGVAGVGV